MKEIINFLTENKFGNLATCVGNKPDVRPMEMVLHSEKGFFFYTSTGEDVEQQLKDNPTLCFASTDKNYHYVKISGPVEFSVDEDDKQLILAKSTFAKHVFKEQNLNNMVVFYVPHGKAMMHMHGNNKPSSYEF